MIPQLLVQATQYQAAGQHAQAEAIYRQILARDPANVDALHLLGRLALETGNPTQAAALVAQALRLRPRIAEFEATQGDIQLALGQTEQAVQSYRRAARLKPDSAVIQYGHGVALSHAGHPEEALQAFRRALARNAAFAPAQSAAAATLLSLGRAAEAEPAFRALLTRAPDDAATWFGLGCACQAQKKFAEAAAAFTRALALDPGHIGACGNLAMVLRELDRFTEAELAARQTVAALPDSAEALSNLGTVLKELGRTQEAAQVLEQAVQRSPSLAEAHFILACTYLLAGDYTRAWPHFTYRPSAIAARATRPGPRWDGNPTGRLLIFAEQGLGDFLQCARFIPAAAARAQEVILAIPPSLHRLAASLPGIAQIVALTGKAPPADCICADMDLPGLLGITLKTIPPAPYLAADPALVSAWQARLAGLPGRRVGIAWSGNPEYRHDHQRSLPLAALEPLTSLADVSFVALQPARHAPPGVAQFPLTDLAETAALITSLDLTITVDTVVAHLAGALGRPVWLLNRFAPDWRWLLNRDDSPWYPSLRQFRQETPGDWGGVIRRVQEALS